tara:strand:- start:1912 stop:2412 length:501 start_codon:yes stop_codon:yes gene_type:complete
MSYINEQLLKTNLILKSNVLDENIDSTINMKLKDQLEGRCFEDGYIIKDSMKIINKTLGKLVVNDNQSSIKYTITYKARVISPSDGDTIESYISNINKMGVILYIRLSEEDTSEDSPLIIMIPREYFNESTYNIDDLNIGQTMNVIVVGCRIKYNSENIQIIAKPL